MVATKKKKPSSKPAKVSSTSSPARVRKLTSHNKKKIVRTAHKIPNSFKLLGRALRHLWRNKKLFGGIFIIYVVLYILFVKGLATNFQVDETRVLIEETLGDQLDGFMTATTLFGALIGTAGTTASESGSVYQLVLFVIFSLAIIWALRATFEDRSKIKIREAFYKGMYPLVPYVVVGLVIILQLIPALVGISVYSIVIANGIAVNTVEQIGWLSLMLLLVGLSVYLVSSSVFASYIVTLEKMAPMQALRSARKLVKFRRWSILRKVLFLPVMIALCFIAVFFPLVLVLPVVAEILFLLCSLALIFIGHAFLYELYRELL
ncbi:MAG: hypothetical protein M3Q14_00035 [bacterium]|nr:hypothetical protein [bacterium]